MSRTAVPRNSREGTATSGAVRSPAVVPRAGAGHRARRHREKVSFPSGPAPRVPPRNTGGSTKSSFAWKIPPLPGRSRQSPLQVPWHFEGVLPRFLDLEWHRLEILRSDRQTVDADHAPANWDLESPQGHAPFAPKHGEAGSTKAQPLSALKQETPSCGLARSSLSDARAGRDRGDFKREF